MSLKKGFWEIYFRNDTVYNHVDNNSFFLRSINDGILEVAGLYSALHIARLQVNMADPLRLGQAKTIKVSGL